MVPPRGEKTQKAIKEVVARRMGKTKAINRFCTVALVFRFPSDFPLLHWRSYFSNVITNTARCDL